MKIFFYMIVAINLFGFSDWKLFDEKKEFKKIEFLDAKVLNISSIGGENFFGISGLAYDKKRKTLFMLNDRSRLFKFKVEIKDKKIVSLKPLEVCRLKNHNGKNFFLYQSDSEGITLLHDKLFISFEGSYPKIREYDKDCKYRRTMYMASDLKNAKNYQGKNRALESLVYHTKYKLLTSPERPLKKMEDGYMGIYNYKGLVCKYKMSDPKSSVVEYETLGDGNLLALFRRVYFPSLNFDISLKKIYLQKGRCRVEEIATLKDSEGANLDNFEGLTKIDKNLYLMISDDNDNFFEETLLVLFELR
ncbi:MAG TPA: esterase-like activity of phytase family protein [Campylobacterales bacterium]|nr:esterase-like activity of phytase family protein [Campylobacterales bacterium]